MRIPARCSPAYASSHGAHQGWDDQRLDARIYCGGGSGASARGLEFEEYILGGALGCGTALSNTSTSGSTPRAQTQPLASASVPAA